MRKKNFLKQLVKPFELNIQLEKERLSEQRDLQ